MTTLSRMNTSRSGYLLGAQILRRLFGRTSPSNLLRGLASAIAERPTPAKIHWTPPASESGYFEYERDYSRDNNYSKPAKKGDTLSRFNMDMRIHFGCKLQHWPALTRKLGHAYEVYPLFFLVGVWSVFCTIIIYISMEKIEVWLDRSQKVPPWDWERARNNYWKLHTLLVDPTGKTHARLEIMEKLQDEMLEAAKKRGTR